MLEVDAPSTVYILAHHIASHFSILRTRLEITHYQLCLRNWYSVKMMPMVQVCVKKACDVMPFGSSHNTEQEDVMLQDILASHAVG